MKDITNKARFIANVQGVELDIKGWIRSMEMETDLTYSPMLKKPRRIHHITLVEDDELDNLRTSFDTINARCSTIHNKENKSMTVKIKKQPVTITLEELKKGEEYEKVTIHINEDKKHEIENKYGVHYGFLPVMSFNDAEFDFKEHYLMVDSNSNKKIPYEIIEKIEVVENAKIIKHKPTKKDYVETDGRTFWKMDIGSYIDDLIQEKLKEIKLDDWILNKWRVKG